MKAFQYPSFLLCILFIISCYPPVSPANTTQFKRRELFSIQQKIQKLNNAQSISKEHKENLISQLKKIDLSISNTSLKLEKAKQAMTDKRNQINTLKSDLIHLQKKYNLAQKHLSNTILLRKKLGSSQPIALLLNQKDPALTSRLMTYISYINEYQINILNNTIQISRDIQKNKTKELKKIKTLQLMIQEHKKMLTTYHKDQKTQKNIIITISNKMIDRSKKIKQLAEDRNKLLKIIKKIASIRQLEADKIPFYKLKNKLPWPIKTRHIKGRGHLELQTNGIYFKTNEGRQVSAVRSGKVVFADWLRGYGLLIIIQHDQGFMTLYANNQVLYKEKGQKVFTGEKIATTGHSGGQFDDGLYFEIRQNGTPVPPLHWLKKKH